MPGSQASLFIACVTVILLIPPRGAAPSLERCSDLLEFGALYYSDLDAADQRTALMQLYNSTGGNTWTQQLISSQQRRSFRRLVTELEDAGHGLANSSLTIASPFPTDLVTDLFNLPALSINCELQQWLSFGQLLLKFEWGSNVSYCRWYGVVCCKTSGDLLNQYCSGPQSIAAVILPGMNLTGSIPATFFTSMVDLQTLILDENPGLVGSVPNLGGQVCSKITSLSLRNTSLMQCNATHLSALKGNATSPQVVNAGRSSNMAADNTTSCLPDVWQFCEPRPVHDHANLMCPSVAYRRPVMMMSNKLVQLQTFLGIINATQNLTLAMLNVTANSPALVGPRVPGLTDSIRGRPGSPSRGGGPGGGPPGPRGPPPRFEAIGCSDDRFRTTGQLKKQGLSAAVSVMGYDEGLFSFVGCRCNAGYDNVYTISKTGRVSMVCVQGGNMSRLLAKQISVGIVVFGVILGLILLLVCRGRQIMTELLKARLNRIKRGHAPGTLQAELAEEMGLLPKEITLVMTDVQASSKLWEWNSRVMHEALDMHDACLRAVLHQHHGYEVATEGDAFTMAFHDPVDALSWALEVQHKLLLLPWPQQLLTQTDAQEECTPESLSLPKQALLLKGLRVRMAIHTGIPDALQVHHVTRQVEYRGDVVSLTEALMDFPAGGQVLLSGSTYQKMYGRLHTLKFDDRVPKQSSISQSVREAGSAAADDSRLRPRYDSRFIAVLDSPQPSCPSSFDLAMEGSQAEMLLRTTTSEAALSPASPSGHYSEALPQSPLGQQRRRGAAARGGETVVVRRVLSGAAGLARQIMGWGRHVGRGFMSLGGRRQDAQLQPERSFFRKWRPSQTDVSGMVNSTVLQKGVTPCVLADGGAFHLAEFARTLCTPFVGSAVHGGIHILQIQSTKLAPRMLLFPALKSTFKVAPAFRDAPGVSLDSGRSFRAKPQPNDTWPGFHPPKQSSAQADLPEVTMVFCGPAQYKELLQKDPAAARSALRHFQSCVRTTLLLSHGYECQEKDGLFMIAFSDPRGAVEWAVLLQLAMLKALWSPDLQQYEGTAEVLSSTGQTLFKGFAAKVGIVHGEMTKICPHTSTGRADYFGSVVNRAARLLCAATAGQTLVEAQLMDDVLRQWSGDAYNLAPIPTAAGSGGDAILGAALLDSGALPLPETAGPLAAEQSMTPSIKSAPQLTAQEVLSDPSSNSVVAEAELQPLTVGGDSRGHPLTLSEAGRSVTGGMKGWGPRAPHASMRSSLAIGNSKLSKQAVSFAPSGPGAIRREGRASAVAASSAGRSIDGVSYTDAEMRQLGVTDSCCAPFAAGDPLAVSNCHMLKFLAASGVVLEGRQEAVIVPQRRARRFGKSSSLSAQRSPRPSQDPQPNMSGGSGSSSVGNGGSRLNSLKPDMKATGLATGWPRTKEGSNNRPVWTPSASQGQPFPIKRVPVQVWGIGAFKFKNIQGISKVMEVQPADLAERMELQSRTLEPGKATCVLSAQYLRCCLNIQLMDVLDLQLSL